MSLSGLTLCGYAAEWWRVQGDVGSEITAQINGLADLDDVDSVAAQVWRRGVPVVELGGAVLDSVERHVFITLGGPGGWLETVAEPGDYFVRFRLTSGSDTESWPAHDGGPAILHIAPAAPVTP